MNVSIELNPAIEHQLREIATKHDLDILEFAPLAIDDLLAHAVNWRQENQPNVKAMLEELASRLQAQKSLRTVQREKNQAAIALLRSWREEDANVSAEEKAIRIAEGKALEEGLAAHPLMLEDDAA